MDDRSKRIAAGLAVIAVCVALNVTLALMPVPDAGDGSLEPAPGAVAAEEAIADAQAARPEHAGEEGGTAAQVPEAGADAVPAPEGLPEGADAALAREAVAACLAQNRIPAASIEVVDSGVNGVDDDRRWWWVYEASDGEGSSMRLTLGYSAADGFYAGVQ